MTRSALEALTASQLRDRADALGVTVTDRRRRDLLIAAILGATAAPPGRRAGTRAEPALSAADPFVAIDFETADSGRDSACAVALVRVERGQVQDRAVRLIRPPRRRFEFTWLHGIDWPMVAGEPTFGPVWTDLVPFLSGARFLLAHNASFDRGVLRACCEAARLDSPALPFVCSITLARRAWALPRYALDVVSAHLSIPLRHHDAASDAEACARIAIAAGGAGVAEFPRLGGGRG